ncbi:MAG: DUF3336 domain-containing protein [Woeseia sp.]|nr:DUF3336 domain-containing protein [Woeseia sp.]
MQDAESYAEWREAAIAYDIAMGFDEWKGSDESKHYDYVSIRKRLAQLRRLRTKKDNEGLLFTLNEGIHGNMGGMGHGRLYSKARFGTKQVINDYIEEIAAALDHLAKKQVRSIPEDEKIEFFHRASQCFGRTALMLSGAGTLLYFHLGVVKALWEQDLLPSIISGSSGGSVIAALVGTHSHSEMEKLFDPEYLNDEVAKEVSFMNKFSPFKKKQIPIAEVREQIARIIPDLTFYEAYELTGIQINISVAPAEQHQSSRLLNAVTSPNVMIREAVLASCAVPGFYPAVTLAARDTDGTRKPYLPARKWIDGSVSEDLPIRRLARLYGVNHTIASQTNPLVYPFINDAKEQKNALEIIKDATLKTSREWTLASTKLAKRYLRFSNVISNLVVRVESIASQSYTGDITILPPSRLYNPLQLLSTRTKEEVLQMIRDGEHSAWEKVETIRLQTHVGRTLDRILDKRNEGSYHDAKKLRAV